MRGAARRGRSSIGDNSVLGDPRWGGLYGIESDFVAQVARPRGGWPCAWEAAGGGMHADGCVWASWALLLAAELTLGRIIV